MGKGRTDSLGGSLVGSRRRHLRWAEVVEVGRRDVGRSCSTGCIPSFVEESVVVDVVGMGRRKGMQEMGMRVVGGRQSCHQDGEGGREQVGEEELGPLRRPRSRGCPLLGRASCW